MFPEGEFERRPKDEFVPAERPKQKKPKDNLHPEGEFERRPKDEFVPAERPKQKKPKDNLHPEGEFERRPKDEFVPAERPKPKKPEDNLFPEGEFERRPKDEFVPAERPKQKKPKDNLHPEGEFEKRPKDEFVPAERPKQKKPKDNLHPEGEFEKRPKDEFVPAERPKPKKPEDNLYSEGDFYGSTSSRNDFTFEKVERVTTIRREDNLRVEGEFTKRVNEEFIRGERPLPIKHEDNLYPEGEFEKRPRGKFVPAERPKPKKPEDNLFPEGQFERRPKDEFVPGERPKQKKPKDNLYLEGEFSLTRKNDYLSGVMVYNTDKKYSSDVSVVKSDDKSQKHLMNSSSVSFDTESVFNTIKETSNSHISVLSKSVSDESRRNIKTVNRFNQMKSNILISDSSDVYDKFSKSTTSSNLEKSSSFNDKNLSFGNKKVVVDSKSIDNVDNNSLTKRSSSNSTIIKEKIGSVTETNKKSVINKTEFINKKDEKSLNKITDVSKESLSKPSSRMITQERIVLVGGKLVSKIEKIMVTDTNVTTSKNFETVERRELFSKCENEINKEKKILSSRKFEDETNKSIRKSINSCSGDFMDAMTSTKSDIRSEEKTGYHRRSVISSSSADLHNMVLHRKDVTSAPEALHTISSAASAQRKSINNLSEIGQYISNSSQSHERKSLSSLHRQSNSPVRRETIKKDLSSSPMKDVSHWSNTMQQFNTSDTSTTSSRIIGNKDSSFTSSSSQRMSRTSEYNVSTSKSTNTSVSVTRKVYRNNASNISFGDSSSITSTSMYRNEFTPRHVGPCPASFIETESTPFKHTRDTKKHKYYLPVVDTK